MSSAYSASADGLPPFLASSALVPAAEVAADPDVALMLEVAAGSDDAFTILMRRHQQALANFFARMGASSDREDLVQETFMRVYHYRRRYRPAARFVTFLYHLARHVWADRGRKIARLERLHAGFERDLEIARQETRTPSDETADVAAALERLSPKLREAIVLNIYQGLRYQEIAEVLEIPLGTVKSRLHLAFAALKEALREY